VCWTYSAKRMSEEIETIHRIREPDRKKDEPDETYSQDHELLYGQLLDPNGLRGKQLFDWYRRIPGVTKKQAEEEVRGGWGFGPDRLC
jgi:hypothetical protein